MKNLFLCLSIFVSFVGAAYATGDIEAGKQKAPACFACHGPTGNTTVSEWPKLAAQHASYLSKELVDLRGGKEGGRYNAVMSANAAPLSDQDIEDLSAYFASLEGNYGETAPEFVELGRSLYRGGDAGRDIPACMACHGPGGLGVGSANFPRLAGQNIDYTIAQLNAFRSGERHNDLNQMMELAAKNLTDEDITALANYINGLKPEELPYHP